MIMDRIDTLTQVTLSAEPQTFNLSFDTYKLPSSDDSESPKCESLDINLKSDEPATAGEKTPSSPGSAIGPTSSENTISIETEDTLNTPISTATDVPSFFSCVVTSIPDPVPITGEMTHFDN